MKRSLLALVVMSVLFTSCKTTQQTPSLDEDAMTYDSKDLFSTPGKLGCRSMHNAFCQELYDPSSSGNVILHKSNQPVYILQGMTKNDHSQVFYRYARAKLRNKNLLPSDLHNALDRQGYFEKLQAFLARKPRSEMSLQDRMESDRLSISLNSMWNSGITETVLTRLNQRFPKFYRLRDYEIPFEIQVERRKTRRIVLTEVSAALWSNDANWKQVEVYFERLKKSFYEAIDDLNLSDRQSHSWKKKIEEVKLVVPGSLPEIADEDCSSTQMNAYYYPYINVITVCAGDFNSEDILGTLSHEMAHALDISRARYVHEKESAFGRRLEGLRRQICSPKPFNCDQWNAYVRNFTSEVKEVSQFTPENISFQRCLKQRPTLRVPTDDDLRSIVESELSTRFSSLAGSGRFIEITKPTLVLKDRRRVTNPAHLNPCAGTLWNQGQEPVDDDLTAMLYFTAGYRCSSGDEKDRVRTSIAQARGMFREVLFHTIKAEGEFSSRNSLESLGLSSPPIERFSDVIGSLALAKYLERDQDIWDRRSLFLGTSAWLCEEPSIQTLNEDESSIQNELVLESHASSDPRRNELFSAPLRKALQCEKDFEFKECLGFLKGENSSKE